MSAPWRGMIDPETVEVIAPGGALRGKVEAWFAGGHFIVEDVTADIRAGDEIRRSLPNGRDDVYAVTDPTCYPSSSFGPHYQIAVSRRGVMDHHQGGHYAINVSGPNARVNIHSTDNSTNISNSGSLFGDLRTALETGIDDPAYRRELLAVVDRMETSQSDASGFATAFQNFVALSANAMTIVTPFLPQLAALLAS